MLGVIRGRRGWGGRWPRWAFCGFVGSEEGVRAESWWEFEEREDKKWVTIKEGGLEYQVLSIICLRQKMDHQYEL